MEQSQNLSSLAFSRDGYHVVRGLCPESLCHALAAMTLSHLQPLKGPVEYEADVGYPGAPANREGQGGSTPRRLLNAYSRADVYRRWATGPLLGDQLRLLLGRTDVFVSQCHHNCVMTKHPGYSSATLWHQDIRYWSFDQPDLITTWLALGDETGRNGALQVIPGSHRMEIDRGRLDSALFLRPELEENQAFIARAETVQLAAGDCLFFHCRTFHAAGTNMTDGVKLSPVFTYHTGSNRPIPDTRSARLPSIELLTR